MEDGGSVSNCEVMADRHGSLGDRPGQDVGQEFQDGSGNMDAGIATGTRHQRRWLFTGLGTRGLLYHALMAELLVVAIRADDESLLPPVLRRWKACVRD